MSNFDPNAMIRGAQLTVVGAYRALQNPSLFNSAHYRQAFAAVVTGLLIRMILEAPIFLVKFVLLICGLFMDLKTAAWDESIIHWTKFVEKSVLQVPFFLMSLMRYITPTMDEMFMKSLDWVDRTYLAKHQSDDPSKLRALYYPNLQMYSVAAAPGVKREQGTRTRDAVWAFLRRYFRKAAISLVVYLLSFTPYVGRFVLPAASFYSFHKTAGPIPACIVFSVGLFVPRHWMVVFLQSYFASRNLMRELLEPYFSRIRFTKEQKRQWFRDREGLLFGFGCGFFFILKAPLLGVLAYGIAEASTAYLITKITDPPPPPSESRDFAETQVRWTNKHEFLKLDLVDLDKFNVVLDRKGDTRKEQ